MTRKTILNQLTTDLVNKLNVNGGYDSEPVQIIEGLSNFASVLQRPIIGYMFTNDIVNKEYMGGGDDGSFEDDNERERILSIILFGQDDVSYEDYETLYNLINDVEKFVMSSDWTYYKQTYLGDISLWVGEVDYNQAYFTLDIKVYYTQTL